MSVTGLPHSSQVQGQVFERGYLVTSAGDTLRGELENRFWQAPPESVTYRPSPNSPAQTYSREQLRAVRLEGERYFGAETLMLDHSTQKQIANLPQHAIVKQSPEYLLAEVLVDGQVSVLRAVVVDIAHYFIQRPGQPALELTERKLLAETGGHQYIVDVNNYKSQLTVYFGDCPAAIKAVRTAAFSVKDIAAVVQAFNTHCAPTKQLSTDNTAMQHPHRPFAFNAGMLAGANFNAIQLDRAVPNGEEQSLLSGLNLDGQLHPTAGLYLGVLLPGRRWVGHSELTGSSFGRRGTFALAGGAGSYTWHGTKLDTRLGLLYMLIQHLRKEFFVSGGFNGKITTSAESKEYYTFGTSRLTAGNVRVPTQAAFIGALGFGLGLYLEAGARYGRFAFSVDAYTAPGAFYTDPLTVAYAYLSPGDPNRENSEYTSYSYGSRWVSYRAYRLGNKVAV
jgi:hypothetical protein